MKKILIAALFLLALPALAFEGAVFTDFVNATHDPGEGSHVVNLSKGLTATYGLDATSNDGTCSEGDTIWCQTRCVNEASRPGFILQQVYCSAYGTDCGCRMTREQVAPVYVPIWWFGPTSPSWPGGPLY